MADHSDEAKLSNGAPPNGNKREGGLKLARLFGMRGKTGWFWASLTTRMMTLWSGSSFCRSLSVAPT